MKKYLGLLLGILIALLCFVACTNGTPNDNGGGGGSDNTISGGNNSGGDTTNPPITETSATLIAYFSCTGTTEKVAKLIETETKGTLYEIVPQEPYTSADLNYYHDSRSDRENSDASARPAIDGSVAGMDKYDVVFLGYPIWFGKAPKIIYTFLESYDFLGKTIIPFCTSGSSPVGSSDTNLHPLAPSAIWKEGKRFPSGVSQSTVADWIKGFN